ncbi:unnamed protein product [Rhizoctonia solani]|uniref:Uncharacterized protein n=1 Tax=Rhizoctonia solani TaxID=456999 RepID=A0A8H3I1N3_9AGAM|nr:unnamed protein product [Rhizoctonia solani]
MVRSTYPTGARKYPERSQTSASIPELETGAWYSHLLNYKLSDRIAEPQVTCARAVCASTPPQASVVLSDFSPDASKLAAHGSNATQFDTTERPLVRAQNANTIGVSDWPLSHESSQPVPHHLPGGPVWLLSTYYICTIAFRRFASPTLPPPFEYPATDKFDRPRARPGLEGRASTYWRTQRAKRCEGRSLHGTTGPPVKPSPVAHHASPSAPTIQPPDPDSSISAWLSRRPKEAEIAARIGLRTRRTHE